MQTSAYKVTFFIIYADCDRANLCESLGYGVGILDVEDFLGNSQTSTRNAMGNDINEVVI